MLIGFADNTNPEIIVSLWRTKLEFITNLVNRRNNIKSNKMKFNKDKWLEKRKIKYTNTKVSCFATMF